MTTTPTYPQSSDVSSGQATLASQYNNLRADALRMGAAAADAVSLGNLLARYSRNVRLTYVATDTIRVPYSATRPPAIVINGYLLTNIANADVSLPFPASAGWYYVFAAQQAASEHFTLAMSTIATEADHQRLIGRFWCDGTHVDQATIQSEEAAPVGDHLGVYADEDVTDISLAASTNAWTSTGTTLTIRTNGGDVVVHANLTIKIDAAATRARARLNIDNTTYKNLGNVWTDVTAKVTGQVSATVILTGLAAGAHTITLEWNNGTGGILYCNAATEEAIRSLYAYEIRRS